MLFPVRCDLQTQPGGDSVQIESSARALRRRGLEVVLCSDGSADPADFDLVHLWHLERLHETYIHLQRARAAGRPVVLTPIYWPWRQGQAIIREPDGRMARRPGTENARNLLRLCRARSGFERQAVTTALLKGWGRARRELLHTAAVLMPNSQAEARQLQGEASRPLTIQIVPNGVDPEECRRALKRAGCAERRGVLCVGNFDPRKNQLILIEALRDEQIELTFVGAPRRNHLAYYRRCRRAAGPATRFVDSRPHGEILDLMARSAVHVLPSHLETPGLASLEAAAMGCTLAVGNCAPVREYFGPYATFLDSANHDSLREGVRQALQQPPSAELRQRVLSRFTWDAAAEAILAAYRQVDMPVGATQSSSTQPPLPRT